MTLVAKVTKPKEPRGRVRFLDDDERARLLQACRETERSPYLYTVVLLALSTGMRHTAYLHLERFDTVFLCLDADQPGREAAEAIAERLGRLRCEVLKFRAGVKDANVWLCSDATAEDVSAAFSKAHTLDPGELKPAPDFVDDVIRQFYPPDYSETGFEAPWERLLL